MILEVCPGVVHTLGKARSRREFLEAARRELEGAGYRSPVLIRTQLHSRSGVWRAWWAVGVSSAGILAEHPELVRRGERLSHRDGTLVIHTRQPGVWLGQGGERVRALSSKWQVRIMVVTDSNSGKITRPRCPARSEVPHGTP